MKIVRLKINKGVQRITKEEAFYLKDAGILRKNKMDKKKGSVVCVFFLPWPYMTQHKTKESNV